MLILKSITLKLGLDIGVLKIKEKEKRNKKQWYYGNYIKKSCIILFN